MAFPSGLYLQDLASDVTVDAISLTASWNLGASPGGGASFVKTLVTNTQTIPANPFQMTKTAGGSPVCWVTPPFEITANIGVALAPNLRAFVDAAAANAGVYAKVTLLRGGAEISTIQTWSSQNAGALTTADAVAGNPTYTYTTTSVQNGDRLVIRLYIGNASAVQMASGHTVTLSYDGPIASAPGDSWLGDIIGNPHTNAFQTTRTPGMNLPAAPPAAVSFSNRTLILPIPLPVTSSTTTTAKRSSSVSSRSRIRA